jgi:acyl-CoA dehydrogenase
MDFKLSDEQREFQKLAKDFAEREMAPQAHKCEQSAVFPKSIYEKAWESGLLNVQVPEAFAGLALSLWDTCLIAESLAWGCSGIASAFEFSTLAQLPLILAGSADQQMQFLAPLSRELSFGGIDLEGLFSEGGATLKASKKGNDYLLHGHCQRLLNAKIANWYVLAAEDTNSHEKRFFVLPSDTKGVTVTTAAKAMGRKLADLHAVDFADVVLPGSAELVLQPRTKRERELRARCGIIIAAGMIGVAQSALDHSVRYANERKTFGKPIAQHQAVGFMMADMAKDLEAARLMTWQAATLADNTENSDRQALCALVFASDMVSKAATDAVQVFGGYGYSREYPVEKLMRDAKAYQTMTNSNHLLKAGLGRELLLA